MAEIISVSVNEEILEEMNNLEKELGFSGRSEIVRAGIRNLLEEYENISKIQGMVEGVFIVTHEEKYSEEFSKLKHDAHSLVQTHIHQELKNHLCMEILIFKGDSQKIQNFYKKLKSSKKTLTVKLVIN